MQEFSQSYNKQDHQDCHGKDWMGNLSNKDGNVENDPYYKIKLNFISEIRNCLQYTNGSKKTSG